MDHFSIAIVNAAAAFCPEFGLLGLLLRLSIFSKIALSLDGEARVKSSSLAILLIKLELARFFPKEDKKCASLYFTSSGEAWRPTPVEEEEGAGSGGL